LVFVGRALRSGIRQASWRRLLLLDRMRQAAGGSGEVVVVAHEVRFVLDQTDLSAEPARQSVRLLAEERIRSDAYGATTC
jgi:hypothetical protein